MSKKHIVGLAFILIAVLIFSNMSNDVSTYSNFSEAQISGERVKIVGQLSKEEPMKYDPENTPNEFQFVMMDKDGVKKSVTLLKPKPQDFERSEQIVLTGKISDDRFVADEILMKCPSKYKEEEIFIKS